MHLTTNSKLYRKDLFQQAGLFYDTEWLMSNIEAMDN
jgi:hypothetical protein